MNIKINENNNIITAIISGEIELFTIREFESKLMEISHSNDKDIELDLSNVDYIASSGLGVLFSLMKLQKNKGKSLIINKISSKVLEVFKLSSISNFFDL